MEGSGERCVYIVVMVATLFLVSSTIAICTPLVNVRVVVYSLSLKMVRIWIWLLLAIVLSVQSPVLYYVELNSSLPRRLAYDTHARHIP